MPQESHIDIKYNLLKTQFY